MGGKARGAIFGSLLALTALGGCDCDNEAAPAADDVALMPDFGIDASDGSRDVDTSPDIEAEDATCVPAGDERCNGVDDDCDGLVDEDFELACRPCPDGGCTEAMVAAGAWRRGVARNLIVGRDRGVALPALPEPSAYVYVANSGDDTVSKIRVSDAVEVGRFAVGDNPSRTAVDGNGDAWVAMRGAISGDPPREGVVKIDGDCEPATLPPTPTRECVLLDVPEVGNLLRGLAVDARGDVWVGSYTDGVLIRLDGATGLKRQTVMLDPFSNVYGLAIDEGGYVWLAGFDGAAAVARIDPATGSTDIALTEEDLDGMRPYGLAADGEGGIWFGSNSLFVFRVDAVTGELGPVHQVGQRTRGVAVDDDGFLWVADSNADQTGCVKALIGGPGDVEAGLGFFLSSATGEGCTDAVEAIPGRHLARIVLRTETTTGREGQQVTNTLDRNLIDRYGYAFRESGAFSTGPTFSDARGLELVPMRVDLAVGSGLPGPHKLMDAFLADLVDRQDELLYALLARYGEASAEAPPTPGLQPMHLAVLGALTRYLPERLGEGRYLLQERPWRMGIVRRRGFVPSPQGGLEVGLQTIFDIHDLDIYVIDEMAPDDEGRAADRLRANMAVGVIATEGERLATMGFERTLDVVATGPIFRDEASGAWDVIGTGGHALSLYPLAVQQAARNRQLAEEELIATPGPVDHQGLSVVAWWRVDKRTGSALGEVRLDGTFYGGVTGVKFLANLDACLWAASIASLQNGRIKPDLACCFENALRSLIKDLVVSAITGRIFAHIATVGAPGIQFFSGGAIYDSKNIANLLRQVTQGAGAVDFGLNLAQMGGCVEPG
jgi:streptogramin lyase